MADGLQRSSSSASGDSPAGGSTTRAYFLVGPTACGKTEIAQRIAKREGWGILSADSMLVYRGMDIGTAKPTAEERDGVSYGGLDLVDPSESFSVGRYVTVARSYLEEARQAGRATIVAGGTGLYVKCLTEGLAPLPEEDPVLRNRLEECLEARGVEGLQDELRRLDEARLRELKDPLNPRRLIRAIELAHHRADRRPAWAGRPDVPLVGLFMEPGMLAKRIEARVAQMYEHGLLDEAADLRERVALSKTALQAIGYAEAFSVLDGKLSVGEAMYHTAVRTRQLAKRQMTWFRRQARVEWVTVERGMRADDVAEAVSMLWRTYGATPVVI
ncbi:MAG TPA: tRNA (adenosine(37)-N6)-dimethylallyltransferase MiaA [Kiritimatiellia bacterium]|nr:tRNA (adenosine(37)-N6)-dimethylallyltransferase MiaA [Kiritimatiellia bacterium]